MKIAILSDIHGIYPALRIVSEHAARWRPDFTVVNGDVVNRGPLSRDCWNFVRERQEEEGWKVTGGNHEAYVAGWADRSRPRHGSRFGVHRSSYWTFRQLGGVVDGLAELPDQIELVAPDGSRVRFTHASMRGRSDGIYADTPEETLCRQISPAPAVFCTAHTHKPLLRCVNGTLIVNSGSVGYTFDGDPRASYMQLSWHRGKWHAHTVRLRYDRELAARSFFKSGFMSEGGPLTQVFFREWREARPLINRWIPQYQERVLAGEMDLAASVEEFLESVGAG